MKRHQPCGAQLFVCGIRSSEKPMHSYDSESVNSSMVGSRSLVMIV